MEEVKVKRRKTGHADGQTVEIFNATAGFTAKMELDVDKGSNQSIYDMVLKNYLVVEKICSFVSLNDMKNMRSVCSHWNYEVAPVMFGRAWCPLMSDENYPNDILRFMREAHAMPNLKRIKKFKLKYMNLTDANTRMTTIYEFFRKHGDRMKRLSLRRCCLDKAGEFWKNLVRISKWTNELQELILDENWFIQTKTVSDSWGLPSRHKIKKLEFISDKSDAALPCVLGEIWKEFPILETLRLVDLTEEENLVLLESMNPGKFKNSKPPLILRELDMFGKKKKSVREIPINQLKLFCQLKLPLTKLTIDIGENILSENFQQLLLAYCSTLKELVFWRGLLANKLKPPGFPFGVNLPVLEFLEVPESCIVDFNFIHHLPRLNRLTIRHHPISHETNLLLLSCESMSYFMFFPESVCLLVNLAVEPLNGFSISLPNELDMVWW